MATPALRQVLSFKTLLAVSFLILLNACGDGTGFSSDEILGESGGEIFYTDPLTDEDEAGVPADDDSTYSSDSGAGSSGGIADYSAPSDETAGIDIPVNIAKYDEPVGGEREPIDRPIDLSQCVADADDEEEDDDDEGTVSGDASVSAVMMKAATNRSKTASQRSRRITLKGAPGTFPNFDGELSLAVINLSTGKSVTAEIFDDGSFPAVTVETESASDAILVGAFNGEMLVKSYAFAPDFSNGEDGSSDCIVLDEEESYELAGEFMAGKFTGIKFRK